MCVFPSRYTPDLLNRVEIRRVRRKLDESHRFPDIFILWQQLLFNKTHCFLVPRGIIHHQSIPFTFRNRMRCKEGANGINGRFVVELLRFCGKENSVFRNNKSTVRRFETTGKRLHGWCAALLVPSGSYSGLYLKMYLVLIYKDQGFVFLYLDSVFLKAFRSSVPSFPLLG